MRSRLLSPWRAALALALCAPPVLAAEPPPLALPFQANGLSPGEAVRRAITTAPSLRARQAQAEQARAAVSLRALDFAPRLDLRASYTRLSEIDQPTVNFGGMEIALFPQILDQYALRAGVTVPISDYLLRTRHSFDAAKSTAQAADWQATAEREATAIRAFEAYVNYARVQAALTVSRTAITTLERHIGDLEALETAGQVTPADVLQAKAQLADAQLQTRRLEGSLRVTATHLRQQLHLDPAAPLVLGPAIQAPPAPVAVSRAERVRIALEERPELRALGALLESNRRTAKAAGAGMWPRLSLIGNIDYTNPNQRIVPPEDTFTATWDATLALSWSPNDAVISKVSRESAELEISRIQADLAQVEEQVRVQLSQASSDADLARAALEAASRGVEAATAALKTNADLLTAGEARPSDVLTAETALRRAQLAAVDARIDAHLATARVHYAMGRASALAEARK